MIYDGYRRESFEFRSVTWPGFVEGGELGMFTGGSLELSALSDLRASGSLDFCGMMPDGHDMVRVYYSFTDEAGGYEKRPLGTFFMAIGEHGLYGDKKDGAVELESVLRVPLNACYGRYYTVKAGTNAVTKAKSILEGLGLQVNAAPSSYVLSRDAVYESDDKWLTICNDLLSMAGFASCWPDVWGTVQMQPYVEPQERTPVWEFNDGERSIMLPKVKRSDNGGDVHNAVKLVYEDEDEGIWACAYNKDPLSEASTVSRGYEVAEAEKVTELSGDTTAARIANLKAKASTKLAENSSAIEYVEWGHPLLPLQPNDAISIEYVTAGLSWRGSITAMQVEIGKHASCTSRARRFVRKGFEITTEGGSY